LMMITVADLVRYRFHNEHESIHERNVQRLSVAEHVA
jgi:hypothetical protein